MKVSDHRELSNYTAIRRDADRGGKEEVGGVGGRSMTEQLPKQLPESGAIQARLLHAVSWTDQ